MGLISPLVLRGTRAPFNGRLVLRGRGSQVSGLSGIAGRVVRHRACRRCLLGQALVSKQVRLSGNLMVQIAHAIATQR